MAENDIIDIDPLIASKLGNISQQSAINSQFPNTNVPDALLTSETLREDLINKELAKLNQAKPNYLSQEGFGNLMSKMEQRDVQGLSAPATTDTDTQAIINVMNSTGTSNTGIPISERFKISMGQFNDPEIQKRVVETNLRNYFKKQNLIGNDYDFGLRLGPFSQRLEFKDPRDNGRYNVIDPVGGDDLAGDLVDFSGDAAVIVPEILVGLGSTTVPGLGQTGSFNILSAALTAFYAERARLNFARDRGYLPEGITDDMILSQALSTAGWSAGGGLAASALFKLGRPILSKLGIVSPKLRFDADEDAFINSFNYFIKTGGRDTAKEIGVSPSSAQVARLGVDEPGISPFEKARRANLARQLAAEEKSVAVSPKESTSAAIVVPAIARESAASDKVTQEIFSDPTVTKELTQNIGETTKLQLGEGIQTGLKTKADSQIALVESTYNNTLKEVESTINDVLNLPPSITSAADVGTNAKNVIQSNYNDTLEVFEPNYKNIFDRWEKATGSKLESVLTGPGKITVKEAVDVAKSKLRTTNMRAFMSKEDETLLNKVLDTFVDPDDARKLRPVSLATLNKNLQDLRQLERRAFKQSLTGEDTPYPQTLIDLTDAIEAARKRILNRKGAPEGLGDELSKLDNNYQIFQTKFKNAQISALAKLRNAKSPEVAFNTLLSNDAKAGTAVKQIAQELKSSPLNADIVNDVGNLIKENYLSKVIKNGKLVNNVEDVHKNFMKNYSNAVESYLPPDQVARMNDIPSFIRGVQEAADKRAKALAQIKGELKSPAGDSYTPESVYLETWKKDEISNFNRILPILKSEPTLLRTYKAFVLKDLISDGRTKTSPNGIEIPDIPLMKEYVEQNKDKISKLFGGDYLSNLNVTLNAMEPALIDVTAKQVKTSNSIIESMLRGVVGVFTTTGRILTAVNKFRGRAREDFLVRGLLEPELLAQMAKASKLNPQSNEAIRIIGKIMLGHPDIGPSDSELNVAKPSAAKVILDDLSKNMSR